MTGRRGGDAAPIAAGREGAVVALAGTPARSWRLAAGIAAGTLALAVALQVLGGAWRSDIGAHPDEPAHLVSALMVRAYLLHGLGEPPMAFARAYYEQYPKVAIGNWPPLYYLALGSWMALAGTGQAAVMLFQAAIAAGLATSLALLLRARLGLGPALGAAVLLLSLPLMQQATGNVMLEAPTAWLCLLAASLWGAWLDRPGWRPAIGFGVLAALALLTKSTAVSLALVPPLSILLSRRWGLLRRGDFWLPLLPVLLIAGPWTWATRNLVAAGWQSEGLDPHFSLVATHYYIGAAGLSLGVLLPLALLGLLPALSPPPAEAPASRPATAPEGAPAAALRESSALPKGNPSGRIISWAALSVGALLLPILVPAGREARHLTPMLAPAIGLAAVGLMRLTAHLAAAREGRWRPWARLAPWALVAIFCVGHLRLVVKDVYGFSSLSTRYESVQAMDPPTVLVCSDATGEGAYIAASARFGSAPRNLVIRRSSKLLAQSTWSGADYQLTVHTPEALMNLLRDTDIHWLVQDLGIPERRWMPHHELVHRTLVLYADEFDLVASMPTRHAGSADGDRLNLYHLRPAQPLSHSP